MSKGKYLGEITEKQLYELCKDHCCLFRLSVDNLVTLKGYDHPLSSSKCREKQEVAEDNGRVITAKHIVTTLTEQDYFTMKEYYGWDNAKIFDCVAYRKGYLPTVFVKSIIKLYKDKTELKDVEGEEVNYLKSKGMLNACYGMTVTDIVRENLELDAEDSRGYVSNYENMSDEEYLAYLKEQINRYNSNPYRFLFYAWGVWVTAYARANLFSGIRAVGEDYIYSDTDSIKLTNHERHTGYIEKYNRDITEKLRIACEYHGIDFSDTKPKNKYGKEKPLGIWEFEGVYDEFKTLGAKRYLWRQGTKYNLTVAGLNKIMAKNYIVERAKEMSRVTPTSPFDVFNLNLVVPKENSGRNVLTYLDEYIEGEVTDYLGTKYHYRELSASHMEATEYSLNPVDEFIQYLFSIREERW